MRPGAIALPFLLVVLLAGPTAAPAQEAGAQTFPDDTLALAVDGGSNVDVAGMALAGGPVFGP